MFRETRKTDDEAREREEVPKEAESINSRSQCEDLHGLLPTVQLVQQRTGAARRMKSQANVVQPHRHDQVNVTRPSVQRGAVRTLVIRLESSEGYTAKNRFILELEDQDEPLTVYVSFVDADATCSVSRNAYVNETACTVAVPESQLGNELTSCDFIYGVLCGVYKYQLYDDSCKGEE
ncbi:hypothetical protein ISCGN_011671 [Ixodes scapularis]